ncbi:MAG: AAA family ATPase [Pseudonocardia sp.]
MLYATPEQVRTERALVAASTTGGAAALPPDVAARFLGGLAEGGTELGVDQAAAVRGVLTSGARVETLVGPAGTGKSFVVGAIARGWTDPTTGGSAEGGVPRRVFGLATSQIATEVLTAEGLNARNVAAWLAAQNRLTTGAGAGSPRPVDGDQALRLHAGDLVVVDESAMTDTAALAAIHHHVDTAGAKLLLVGDHRQLAAVGAGGGMDLIASSGARYELTEARRFTHDWERGASLRLRAGDDTVLREYHQQGRLLDSGTAEQAEESAAQAWLGDTLAGRRSLLPVDQRAGRPRLRADSRRARPTRAGRRARGRARDAGHRGRGGGPGRGPQARLDHRRLRGHPPPRDQPRALPRPGRSPRRRARGRRHRGPHGGRTSSANTWSSRPPTWPSTWRWATRAPCTPRRAAPWTPPTPSSPPAPARQRSTSECRGAATPTPPTSPP